MAARRASKSPRKKAPVSARRSSRRRRPVLRLYKLKPHKLPPRLPDPPPPFQIVRSFGPGNYALTAVFPGFLETTLFRKYPGDPELVRSLAEACRVQIVAADMWMYVAPHELPPFAEAAGWKPHTSRADCIVVGQKHLADSPGLTLFLDIYHEFSHILQRHSGRELWDEKYGYVDSPTELEAYGFVIAEARALGVSDSFLRAYLEVEWVSPTDHLRLLRNLGVALPGRASPPARPE